jgi:hypothetical protein
MLTSGMARGAGPRLTAARLGADVVFPGGHTALVEFPSQFRAALLTLLHGLWPAKADASACR